MLCIWRDRNHKSRHSPARVPCQCRCEGNVEDVWSSRLNLNSWFFHLWKDAYEVHPKAVDLIAVLPNSTNKRGIHLLYHQIGLGTLFHYPITMYLFDGMSAWHKKSLCHSRRHVINRVAILLIFSFAPTLSSHLCKAHNYQIACVQARSTLAGCCNTLTHKAALHL